MLRSVPKGSIGRVEGRVRSPAAGAHPDSPCGAAGGHAASPSMRLDLSTLRAERPPGQTEHPSGPPVTEAGIGDAVLGEVRTGGEGFVLRVGAAAVKVVRASRRSFDEIDDLMSAFRPLSPRSENSPRTGRT